jgi:actin-like ATPase involved in cell morphogenesis
VAGYRLGIDIGTSTTVACLQTPDRRIRPLLFDGSPLLPSAVYLDDAGRLVVGRDAIFSARAQPARLEPNPKQRIDDGEVLLGDDEVSVPSLIAAILRRVVQAAFVLTGGQPVTTIMAYPAAWGERRRRVLLDAASLAGIPAPVLVAEPIAAVYYFEALVRDHDRPAGNLVVYDLGAGTFDVSVIVRTTTGFEVRATDGLADVGGLDLDAAIVAYLGALDGEDERWNLLEQPSSAGDLRARRQLWDDVRTAKEVLSRSATAVIYVPIVDKDVPLGRAQLERLARPLLERTVATTRSALRRAELDPADPLEVFLVGGSSRVPLAATLLHRALRVAPTVIEQPELVVAEGCLIADAAADTTPAEPAWVELVQVLEFGIGDTVGYTLRCYVPTPDGHSDDALFLSRSGRLLVFGELRDLIRFVKISDDHDLASLTDWRLVVDTLDVPSAQRHLAQAQELARIAADIEADIRAWSADLFVAARDLAVELVNALSLAEVRDLLAEESPLDILDEAMREHVGRESTWWRGHLMLRAEVAQIRRLWRRVVAAIEEAVVRNPPPRARR